MRIASLILNIISKIFFIGIVPAFWIYIIFFTPSAQDRHKDSCIITAKTLGYEGDYKENKDICLYYDSQKNIKAIQEF